MKDYPETNREIDDQTFQERCNNRVISVDCPVIFKIAKKFDVTEDQVRHWIESGNASCYSYWLPMPGEGWFSRVRTEITGGAE